MKKIFFVIAAVLSLTVNAHVNCTTVARAYINANIKTNGVKSITGLKLNISLIDLVDAINCSDSMVKIKSIVRNAGKDSLVITLNDSTRIAFKDSVGTGGAGAYLAIANNLSDVASASTSRTNLGLGTAAVQNTSAFLQPSNNLSDVGSASTSRTNLGLGTAATQSTGTFLQAANNLSDGTASTMRTNLGATGIGIAFFTLTNPSAVTYPRMNADNTVTSRTAAQLKSDLSLDNVENTALSTWAGSTNITTLGTIGTGVWSGTAVGISKGGTGATTANAALVNLGGTGVGINIFNLTDPSAITFLRINADNTVTARSATNFKSDLAIAATDLSGLGTGVATNLAETRSFQTLTDGATITYSISSGYNAKVTLGGNRTLSITNAAAGDYGTLIVTQDGTGSRTLTLPGSSKVINGGSGSVTLTTTASAIDVLSWFYDGTNYFWTYGKNYN